MQIDASYDATSFSVARQTFETAFTVQASTPQAPTSQDHVEVSDEALASSGKLGTAVPIAKDPTLELIRNLLSAISGTDTKAVEATSGELATGPSIAGSYEEASLSTGHVSLSLSGTVSTKDGKEVGFSLDLSYDHVSLAAQTAQFQAGADEISFSYAGTAAELTSTSFAFTMSAAGDTGAISGRGEFRLNDDISRVAKEMKPAVKEFMDAAGIRGGWGTMNRFLRSIG